MTEFKMTKATQKVTKEKTGKDCHFCNVCNVFQPYILIIRNSQK